MAVTIEIMSSFNTHHYAQATKHGPGTYGIPMHRSISEDLHCRYLQHRGPRMAPVNKYERTFTHHLPHIDSQHDEAATTSQ